ncbi:MAG: MaoC family dehydratase [Flavobacteriaceae bacterium]
MTTTATERDPLAVGTEFPTRKVRVTDEYLGRYIEGIRAEDNPWYLTDSPYGGPRLPACMFFYEPSDFADAKSGRKLRHHGEDRMPFNSGIEWWFYGPGEPGKTFTLDQRVIDRWLKRGREWAIFEMRCKDDTGRLLAKCAFKESWAEPPVYDPPLRVEEGKSGELAADGSGELLGSLSRLYTFEMSAAFCRPNRDFHTDRELARANGFADVVLSGPQFTCQVAELMTRIFGRGFYEGGHLKLNFLKPVLAGETIDARVNVIERVKDDDGVERVKVAVTCTNDEGVTTAGGIASARVIREDYSPGFRSAA